ncbi:MAG: PAS domain S-box protein [Bacteroidota bacterium]
MASIVLLTGLCYYYDKSLIVLFLGTTALILNLLFLSYIRKSILTLYSDAQIVISAGQEMDTQEASNSIMQPVYDSFQKITDKMEDASLFINAIKSGEDNVKLESLDKNDHLYGSIEDLQTTISKFNDEQQNRSWISDGIAKFSDILRLDFENEKEMANRLISELVKYLGVNQAAVFIVQSEELSEIKKMQMAACYAYDKQKLAQGEVQEGEGLLGQVMLEKDTLFLTDIPTDYTRITSGLGLATPRNVVVSPLIINDEFYGAIELASFNILQKHQIEFLEKVCQAIAAQLATLKTSIETKKLLKESQSLTTELQSREEQMRQNMEELNSTQEEMERRQGETEGLISAIDSTLSMAEIGTNGLLLNTNTNLEHILEKDKDQLIGFKVENLFTEAVTISDIIHEIETHGTFSKEISVNGKSGTRLWLNASFTPFRSKDRSIKKVLMLAKDVTSEKILEIENEENQVGLNAHLEAINKTIASCEFDMHGNIIEANNIFLGVTGYDESELIGKNQSMLIPGNDVDKPQNELMWENIRQGQFFSGEFKLSSKSGEELWLVGTYNPIKDRDGNPYKVMMFAQFTTGEKEKQKELSGIASALKCTLPVLELKHDGTFKTANKLFFDSLGYSRMTLRSKSLKDLIQGFSSEKELELLNKLAQDQKVNQDFNFISENGDIHSYQASFYPIHNLQDKITKIVAVLIKNEVLFKVHQNDNRSIKVS